MAQPVISIGNLTAGGTGKTPVVRWLCESLSGAGRHPAVLMRGYGAKTGQRGDEQIMLETYLSVIVQANANRFDGGVAVLREHPEVDVFVLDDGFQHQRLARDFDLVLIDATCPFGYGHVHPRGLLREPLSGLNRADAILITRYDAVTAKELAAIQGTLRRWNKAAPIYHARHSHTGLRATDAGGVTRALPLSELTGKRSFAFCGIGRPQSFLHQLRQLPGTVVGDQSFPDHHAYNADDLTSISDQADAVKADILLTTEKDWGKLAPLVNQARLRVWRVELSIEFHADDGELLLNEISRRIGVTQFLSPP